MVEISNWLNEHKNLLNSTIDRSFYGEKISFSEINSIYNKILDYFYSSEFETLLSIVANQNFQQTANPENNGKLANMELYELIQLKVTENIEKQTQIIESSSGEECIDLFTQTFDNFLSAVKICLLLFEQINVILLRTVPKALKSNYPNIDKLLIGIANKSFVSRLNDQILSACFKLIDEKRSINNFDLEKIEKNFRNFVKFDAILSKIDQSVGVMSKKNFYEENFVEKFFESTEKFYLNLLSTEFGDTLDESRLETIKNFLDREEKIFSLIFPEKYQKILNKRFRIFLVRLKNDSIDAAAKMIIEKENSQIFSILIELLQDHDERIQNLAEFFNQFLTTTVLTEIEKFSEPARHDFELYVGIFIKQFNRFDQFHKIAFKSNQHSKRAIDRTFESLVNTNSILTSLTSPSTVATMFSQYADLLLDSNDEATLKRQIDEFIAVFIYVSAKDMFEDHFWNSLAVRLIENRQTTGVRVKFLLEKIQEICGAKYVRRLKRMIDDITESEKLLDQYKSFFSDVKEQENKEKPIDIDFILISSFYWPFSPSFGVLLPEKLQLAFDNYKLIHKSHKEKSRLELVCPQSYAIVEMNVANRSYSLHINTFQLSVLFMFESSSTHTVEQIGKKTNIDLVPLSQVLCSLLTHRILTCENLSNFQHFDELNENHIKLNFKISFNENFQSESSNINPLTVHRSYRRQDSGVARSKDLQHKIKLIEAAIVRTLKKNKSMEIIKLEEEIMNIFEKRSEVVRSVISECVETLIEKEYIKRSQEDNNVLNYIP